MKASLDVPPQVPQDGPQACSIRISLPTRPISTSFRPERALSLSHSARDSSTVERIAHAPCLYNCKQSRHVLQLPDLFGDRMQGTRRQCKTHASKEATLRVVTDYRYCVTDFALLSIAAGSSQGVAPAGRPSRRVPPLTRRGTSAVPRGPYDPFVADRSFRHRSDIRPRCSRVKAAPMVRRFAVLPQP